MKIKVFSKNALIICFFIFCILPLLFVVQIDKSLWLDEAALALNVLDKSYLELFQPLQYAQSAPPLFLCLTKVLVSLFGLGERVLRFIPFFCTLASIVWFWFLLQTVFYKKDKDDKRSVLCFSCILTAAFCFQFPFLYNAIEFKSYSTDVLFTILTAFIWFKYLDGEVSAKKEAVFGFLLALFPLFSFGSIFPLCAVLILSLFKRRLIFSSILAFGLLIEYLFIFSKINAGTRVYEYWVPYFMNYNLFKAVFISIENIGYYFSNSYFALIGFVLFIAGFIFLFGNNKKVFWFFALTFLGAYSASFFNFYPLYERLSFFLYPATLIIVVFPLFTLLFKKKVLKRFVVLLLTGFTLFFGWFQNYMNPEYYKREEIKPLLKTVQREINPGDKVFVFKGAHLTYRYYLKTKEFKALDGFETFVCPYNMQREDCAEKIEPFCGRGGCYILYSSEVNALNNLKFFEDFVSKLNGKILQKDKNSMLYKVD